MNIKLGYYPILDMVLAFRQLFSGERFKPFNSVMDSISSKLTDNDKDFILSAGDLTKGWLSYIEEVIELTLNNVVSPEEFILYLYKFSKEHNEKEKIYDPALFADKFSTMWQSYFSSEVSRGSKAVFDKTMELNRELSDLGLKNYLLKLTDRVTPTEDNKLKVLIKPEHIIDFDKLKTAIVMPSIFACRNFTFWCNEQNYVFYVSLNCSREQDVEPSDMLLLKTLALNDKTRLKMLRILHKRNFTTADMASLLNMNSSTVSRHFKVFKDAGFADIFTQEGNSIYYSLNLDSIEDAFRMILKYIKGEV